MTDEFEGMTRKQANDSIKPTSGVMPTDSYDKVASQQQWDKLFAGIGIGSLPTLDEADEISAMLDEIGE
jgi:hypothetical protein